MGKVREFALAYVAVAVMIAFFVVIGLAFKYLFVPVLGDSQALYAFAFIVFVPAVAVGLWIGRWVVRQLSKHLDDADA